MLGACPFRSGSFWGRSLIDSGGRRYRDDWATKHFLHPKTLRKAREVRTQLLDIMKHQRLDIVPCGTDWDVIRCVSLVCGDWAALMILSTTLQEDDLRGVLSPGGSSQGNRRVPALSDGRYVAFASALHCCADLAPRSVPMNLHPTSALYGLGFLPDFTVYHEVRPPPSLPHTTANFSPRSSSSPRKST